MRVLVAGSSGFLGQHLGARLREAGAACRASGTPVRGSAQAPDEEAWQPYDSPLDPAVLDGVDVVVNLAGSPTAGNPHSKAWARELRESRVTTTRVLADAIAAAESTPAAPGRQRHLVLRRPRQHAASPRGSDSRGDALLTSVTREWEAAADPARRAGARVVVLADLAGAGPRRSPLKQMLLAFRVGLAPGSATAASSSRASRCATGSVLSSYAADNEIHGPVNLCCPQTPTNAEFTEALADAVGRKARLFVPSLMLRRAAGAMAPELLGSLNARPDALEAAGYRFHDRTCATCSAPR